MIELKVKSENYIPKEEVEKILNKMEAEHKCRLELQILINRK